MRATGFSAQNRHYTFLNTEDKKLALEVIQAIRETETKAGEIKKQALTDSKELIRKAEKQNEEYFEQKTREANEKAAGILAEYEEQARLEQQKMKADADGKAGEIRQKASRNMDSAVQFILGRLG
jgi:vacuolar-type H+-ATPase subunit H